jgi:hypothetical protein
MEVVQVFKGEGDNARMTARPAFREMMTCGRLNANLTESGQEQQPDREGACVAQASPSSMSVES